MEELNLSTERMLLTWCQIVLTSATTVLTSDADVLADRLEVAHDPRRGSEVADGQRSGLGSQRETDLQSGAARDTALRSSS